MSIEIRDIGYSSCVVGDYLPLSIFFLLTLLINWVHHRTEVIFIGDLVIFVTTGIIIISYHALYHYRVESTAKKT